MAEVIELSSDSENEGSYSERFENQRQFQEIWKLASHAIPIDLLTKNESPFSYSQAKNVLTIVKKKVSFIKDHELKDYVLRKLLHLFQAYKLAFLSVDHDDKINFLMLDIMALYVKFQCEKSVIAEQHEALINNLASVLHIIFNGNSLYIVMTLLKVDFKESYIRIVYPILLKQISISKLNRTNDIICYMLLILCIKKWEKINLIYGSNDTDSFKNIENVAASLSLEDKYKPTIKVKAFLPDKVPAADEMRRSFTRISDLIGYAISKGDDGTSILLENGSMNLKETIENYFKQYEHLICFDSTSSLEKFTQNMYVGKTERYCRTLRSKWQMQKNHQSFRGNNYLDVRKQQPSDSIEIEKNFSTVFWDVLKPHKCGNYNSKKLGINAFEEIDHLQRARTYAKNEIKKSGVQADCSNLEENDCQIMPCSESSSSKFSTMSAICIKSLMFSSSISHAGIFQNLKIDSVSEINKDALKYLETNKPTTKHYASKSSSGIICVQSNNYMSDISHQVRKKADNALILDRNENNYAGEALAGKDLKNDLAKIISGNFSKQRVFSKMKNDVIKKSEPYFTGTSLLTSVNVFHVSVISKILLSQFLRSLKPLFYNIFDAYDGSLANLAMYKQQNSPMLVHRVSTLSNYESIVKICYPYGKIDKEKVEEMLRNSIIEVPIICSLKRTQSTTNTYVPNINEKFKSEKRNWRKRKRTENMKVTSTSSKLFKQLEKPNNFERLSNYSMLPNLPDKKEVVIGYNEGISKRTTKIALSINFQRNKNEISGTNCYTKRKSENKNHASVVELEERKKKKTAKQSCGEYISQNCSWSDVERFIRDSLSKLKLDKANNEIGVLLSALSTLSKAPSLEAYFIINKIIVTFIYECLLSLDRSRITLRKYLSICSKAKKLQAKNVDDSHLNEIELKYEELKVNINNPNIIYHFDHVLDSLRNLKKKMFVEKWLQQNKSKIKRYLYAEPVEYSSAMQLNKVEQHSKETPNIERTDFDKAPIIERSARIKDAKVLKKRKISPLNISRPVRKIEDGLHSTDVSFCDFVGEYGSTLGSSILDFMPDEIKLDGPIIPFPQNSGNFNEILEHSLSEADISSLSDNDTHDQFFNHQGVDSSNMFTNPIIDDSDEQTEINDPNCNLIQACINTKMYVPKADNLINKTRCNTSHVIENERNLNCNPFWKSIIVGPNDCYKVATLDSVNNAK